MKVGLVFIGLLSYAVCVYSISYCYKYPSRGGYVIDMEGESPEIDQTCAEVKTDLGATDEATAPRCLENGDYDLFQCSGANCFCSDCAGLKIENFEEFPRGDHGDSQCACAREAHEFFRSGMLGVSYRCDPNGGHYKSYQCRGTGCHCTHKDGTYIETEDPLARFTPWQAEGKDEFCATLQ